MKILKRQPDVSAVLDDIETLRARAVEARRLKEEADAALFFADQQLAAATAISPEEVARIAYAADEAQRQLREVLAPELFAITDKVRNEQLDKAWVDARVRFIRAEISQIRGVFPNSQTSAIADSILDTVDEAGRRRLQLATSPTLGELPELPVITIAKNE